MHKIKESKVVDRRGLKEECIVEIFIEMFCTL